MNFTDLVGIVDPLANIATNVPWTGITGKPAVIAEGATQVAARAAIGAGTGNSNLTLGTTAGTAREGNWTPSMSDVGGLNAAIAALTNRAANEVVTGNWTFPGEKYQSGAASELNFTAPFNGTTIPNGYLKLVTPIKASNNQMFSIDVVGYDYNAGKSIDFTVVGYAYAATSTIINIGFSNRSSFSRDVRLVLEARDGGERVMVLALGAETAAGVSNQAWYFQKLSVKVRLWDALYAAATVSDFSWVAGETTLSAGYFSSTNLNKLTMDGQLGTIVAGGTITASNLSGVNTGDQTNIAGNAATATKLATARTINGVSFDGSANITVADSTKAPLTGTGTSGTWPINITGAASVATTFSISDTRAVVSSPNNVPSNSGIFEFKNNTSVGNPPNPASGTYSHVLTINGWTADGSGGWPTQLSFGTALNMRQGTSATTWGAWKVILDSNNVGNYAPSLTGTGASGTWGISITGNAATATNVNYSGLTGTAPTWNQSTTGNAATATKLATARTINGVSFDGSANVTGDVQMGAGKISFSTANPDICLINVGGRIAAGFAAAQGFNASSLLISSAWVDASLVPTNGIYSKGQISSGAATGVAPFLVTSTTRVANLNVASAGNADTATNVAYSGLTGTVPTWNQSTTGNAGTATILQTARTINGVSFNGSANITVADSTKEPTITAGTTAQYWRGDKSWQTLNKAAVGLTSVDDTSDVNKPVSTATTTALNLKANLASPTLTGVPAAPTAAVTTNTTQLATTAFVNAEIANDAAPIAHVGSGAGAHANVVAAGASGFMTGADKTKLDNIATGATANTGTVTSVGGTGTVNGLTLTGTVTSTGNLTLGGTLAVGATNFASQAANTVLAAPAGAAGVPTFRTIVAADVPVLNQNTTGNAGTATVLQTARTINGVSFNGSANITVEDVTKTPLTGTGASGTWGISVTGTAGVPIFTGYLSNNSSVDANTATTGGYTVKYLTSGAANKPAGTDGNLQTLAYSTSWATQIYSDWRTNEWSVRNLNNGTWGSWKNLLHSGNFNDYVPTLTGTGASGTWGISITGNAATATKLATPRNINGIPFDGSANITISTGSPILDTTVISTNTTAVVYKSYVITASLTLTLPASPVAGNWIDIQNSSGTVTITVARNSQNIMSLAEDMTIDINNSGFRLMFADATRGWVII